MGDALSGAAFGDKRVSWLLAVPVSAADVRYVRYLRDHGDAAFEDLLESCGADVTSLSRASVV